MNSISQEKGLLDQQEAVNRAFTKQAAHYDEEDLGNPILRDMRQQTYAHALKYIKPNSTILELNAGTGIDALNFARQGHRVHATDIATGMIEQIQTKIAAHNLKNLLSCQQVSYDQLQHIRELKFDYVFSNFGGLNCIEDLESVTTHLPRLLKKGGYVTLVIMPPVYIWELLWFFKGHGKQAFRRFHKHGVFAHLEGEHFKTYYHSLTKIKKAFGPAFRLVQSEGLCALSPPPSRGDFPHQHPVLHKMLRSLDAMVRSIFPFNRWADHIIVTFKLVS